MDLFHGQGGLVQVCGAVSCNVCMAREIRVIMGMLIMARMVTYSAHMAKVVMNPSCRQVRSCRAVSSIVSKAMGFMQCSQMVRFSRTLVRNRTFLSKMVRNWSGLTLKSPDWEVTNNAKSIMYSI